MDIRITNTQTAKDDSLVLLSSADSFNSLINTMSTIKNSINNNWSNCTSKNNAIAQLDASISYYKGSIVPALEKLGTSVTAYAVATEQLASLNHNNLRQPGVQPLSYVSSDLVDTPSKYADLVDLSNKINNPDFSNQEAWGNTNPYTSVGLYGQCTWFAWGRFYEIYGKSPGFTRDGRYCVDQLLETLPNEFYASDTPVAGSVFSISPYSGNGTGHVGIITSVDGDMITVQDGNMDGITNTFSDATKDWRTRTITIDEFNQYVDSKGTIKYANPYNFSNPKTALDKFNSTIENGENIELEDPLKYV